MPGIQVLLEVPPAIVKGLASGHLERVGGVVRNASSKEIVAWLREGGQIATNQNIADGLLGTLVQASSGINPIMSVVDLAFKVGSQAAIMNALQHIGALVMFNGAIGLLNVTISAASLGTMILSVRKLEKKIDAVAAQVAAEFAKAYDNALKVGLKNAEKAQIAKNTAAKLLFAGTANANLEVAQISLNSQIEEMVTNGNLDLLQNLLLQAFQIHGVLLRCYLEIGASEVAVNAKKDLPNYEKRTRETIRRFLDLNQGIYFHQNVREDDLKRYIRLRQWLDKSSEDIDTALGKLVWKERRYFWDQNVIREIAPKVKLTPKIKKIVGKKKNGKARPQHIEALDKAEALMFSYCHLQSLHTEIEAVARLGIPYSEWQEQQDEVIKNRLAEKDTDIDRYDDFLLLVDRDSLMQ